MGGPLPNRSACNELLEDAKLVPARVKCQYSIYPLGTTQHTDVIYNVIAHAQQSPSYKVGVKTHFCSMLDGTGLEVFGVLRASLAIAREKARHVVMTATVQT